MSQDTTNLDPVDLCVDCQKRVIKKFVKYHSSNTPTETKKRRKYCDETGRLWHGKRCPSCAVNWRRDCAEKKSKEKQEALKSELGE